MRAKTVLAALAFVSLLGTLTNFVPVSLSILLCLPFILVFRDRVPRFLVFLVAFLILCIISTLIIDPSAFFQYDFYRRDGNIFVSYLPLIILSGSKLKVSFEVFVKFWIFISAAVYSLVFAYYLATTYGTDTFAGLFIARNALGGFLCEIACAAYGLFRIQRSWTSLIAFLLFTICLIATYSRGSLLGLFLAIILFEVYLLLRNSSYRLVPAYLIFLALFSVCLYIGYSGVDSYSNSEDTNDIEQVTQSEDNKAANIAIRAYFVWPKSIYCFLESPLIGVGFGAFDDDPLQLDGLPFFKINTQSNRVHTDAHAHNSYLNVMAENGSIGIILILCMLSSMCIYLDKSFRLSNRRISGVIMLMLYGIVFSSFTEHRLFTPSQALPFTLAFGLYVSTNKSFANKLKFRRNNE